MRIRNHIILCILYVFTILLTIYLCLLYRISSSNVNSSFISNYLFDVTDSNYSELYDNINNFGDEYDVFYLYIASYKDLDLSSFEGGLRNIVSGYNIKNIIYINFDELKKSDYLQKLLFDFGSNKSYDINNLPLFIIFKDGVISDVFEVYGKDDSFLKNVMEVNDD